jgi:hypothetical protein
MRFLKNRIQSFSLLLILAFLTPTALHGQFVQDEFVLGAYMIPELNGNTAHDLPLFQDISDANFNLIMYPGEREAAETFYSNNNAYILDLASQVNLQVLAYDEGTFTIEASEDENVPTFDQNEADSTSDFYLGLPQNELDALYGFYLKDEPPHPDSFPSQLDHVRAWTEHFIDTLPGRALAPHSDDESDRVDVRDRAASHRHGARLLLADDGAHDGLPFGAGG